MTCPSCKQDGGHYLSCQYLDEHHALANLRGFMVFLGVVALIAVGVWAANGAGATPELEERRFPGPTLFWQDGFNVPEGQEKPEVARSEAVEVAPADWGAGVEVWRPLVEAAFPADEVELALCVMRGESGGNPDAQNPSGASGLFQIMPFWAHYYGVPYEALFNPEANVNLAAILRADEGWDEWSVYNRGVCS